MSTDAHKMSPSVFQALIEHSTEAIVLMRLDGTIVYSNTVPMRVLGYSLEELIGSNGFDRVHPDDLERVQAILATIVDKPGASVTFDYRALHKHGYYKWLEGTATNLLSEPNIQAIVGSYHDITERKQKEEQLRTSEERYRSLVEQASEGIFLADTQGRYLEVNSCGCKLFGYTRAELLTMTVYDLVAPEDHYAVQPALNDVRKHAGRALWRMIRKDGTPRMMEISTILLSTGEIQAIVRDMTEQLLAEEERKALLAREQAALAIAQDAQQHLQDLFMQAPACICVLSGPEHQLELINDHFRRLYGNREFFLGKPARENWPDLEGQGFFELLDRVYSTGEPFIGNEVPAMIDRTDTGILDLGYFNMIYQPARNTEGKVRGILVHAVEVTDQVRARQNIQKSEARLRRLIDANIVGVIFCDMEGHVTEANDVFLQMLGYTQDDVETGKVNWVEITPPDYREVDEKALQELMTRGMMATPFEKAYRRKDGSLVPVLVTAAALDAVHPQECVAFILDITPQKELEQRKDDFISMASHELKTPVTSIKGFTQVLIRRFEKRDDPETLRFLRIMDGQLKKLTKLVSDLLDMSRIQTGKLTMDEEYFDLDELVREMVEQMQATTKTHQIELTGTSGVQIKGDRDRISQVLSNLLANAIKYSPEADRVNVSLHCKKQKLNDACESQVIVKIQDFGIGIDTAYYNQIFNQFYQINDFDGKNYSGLGIGLYLSQQIVELHRGKIWVDSVKGKGSTFSFILPAAVDPSESSQLKS